MTLSRWIAASAALFASAPCAAQTIPTSSAPRVANAVNVTVIARPEDRDALQTVVRELLERLPIALRMSAADALDLRAVVEPPPSADAFARVWIDGTRPSSVGIFLCDLTGARVLIVNVALPASGSIGEVTREEVSLIVRDAVAALREGRQIGLSNAEARAQLGVAPPTAPTPPTLPAREAPARGIVAPRRALRASRIELSAGYSVEALWGSAWVAHGPIAQADIVFAARAGWSWSALVQGQYRFAQQREALIGVTLDQLAARALLATGPQREGARWGFRAALGAGWDSVLVTPQRGTASASDLAPPQWQHLARVRAQGTFSLALHRWIALSLGVYVDVDVQHVEYVLERNDAPQSVLAPSVVRPGLSLSVALGER